MQHGVFVLALSQTVEGIGHRSVGFFAQGTQVQIHLLQHAAAVIGAVVDIDDVQFFVQQIDRRQDAVAVHATRVQIVGLEVGGRDKAHAVVKQGVEQAVQDHGIGDVGHMELVKTNQLVPFGHLLAQHIQGIDGALQLAQLTVDLSHELMEMQTRFATDRYRFKKAIHQKTFAAPHAAVHVDTAWNGRTVDQLLQGVRTLLFVGGPFAGTTL